MCVFRKNLSNHCEATFTYPVQVLCLIFNACSGQYPSLGPGNTEINRVQSPFLKPVSQSKASKVGVPLPPSPKID